MQGKSGKKRSWLCVCAFTVIAAGLVFMAVSNPAQAIPSPELIVGSISGLSQLAALFSAVLGGGALAFGAQARRRQRGGRNDRHSQSDSRWSGWVLPVVLVVATVSLGANLYLWVAQHENEQARLEATLLRATPKNAEGKPLDAALKETSFAGQATDPHGITTSAAAKLIEQIKSGAIDNVEFLDIREPVEAEMGTLPASTGVRFPDLETSNLKLEGKTVVLFCHNGNRSFETCQRLAERGIDCRFIVGGLEKWLVEGRQLTGTNARSLGDLRALPSYPNQTSLLTTKEVKRLRAEDNVLFVDVRYPGEFATGHLPGAINLPIRPTPTAVLEKTLAALPGRPIVAPCYDRRSCFYAEILGLMVSRLGRDFRGRYTEPWTFTEPRELPPHVKTWQAAGNKVGCNIYG